ncbi:class I SAM-dependent methyltransferase [Agromyces badenianii]|uniref:class I SAM-dependent methyltransferase n=1 Tax=Agromyces badenianii TaxID=2080742 RepID=UPI0014047423|nr:class I SAM-dependent methyltransferase [Agromyces badenianii]
MTARSSEWLNVTSYLLPTRVVTSAWLEHAPFAFWIVNALRPSSIVELGTHNGFSFFTWCEALQLAGLSSSAYAIDTWVGDDQAGFYDDVVYQEVAGFASEHYPDTTHLLRGYFDDFVDEIPDRSVDLIHIDGRHGYEDIVHDFNNWLPKASERGVILFHDIAERGEGFGVWRFWEDVSVRFPSFAFEHGHGLGVLAVGANVPTAVLSFLDAAARQPEVVRSVYAGLGARVTRQAQLLEAEAERDMISARLVEAEADLAAVGRDIQRLTDEQAALKDSTSWKATAPLRAITGRFRRSRGRGATRETG